MNSSPDITNKIDKWNDIHLSLSLILPNPSPETDRQAREEAGNRQETPTGLQREAARKIGKRI